MEIPTEIRDYMELKFEGIPLCQVSKKIILSYLSIFVATNSYCVSLLLLLYNFQMSYVLCIPLSKNKGKEEAAIVGFQFLQENGSKLHTNR
jgi:hypothetical protein